MISSHSFVGLVLVRVQPSVTGVAAAETALLQRVPPARAAALYQVLRFNYALVSVLAAQSDLLACPFAAASACPHLLLGV